ncbi:MAG: methyltransferase domain-containing protein [Alcanivoracaceae bacterium]
MNYTDLFDLRGSSYEQAMRSFADARREEFEQLIQRTRVKAGDVVVDVPAGGGYLRNYLPPDCHWRGHEPSAGFGDPGASGALLPLPFADHSADIAVSLAGVHHIENKRELWQELYRVVRPGGRLVLSDVGKHSPVHTFLDGYVDANNSTGHRGHYLCQQTVSELTEAGWQVRSCETVSLLWRFPSLSAMGQFCRLLFDLHSDTLEGSIAAIQRGLGTTLLDTGETGMHWELLTLIADRPA